MHDRTTENQVVLNMDCTHKLTINGVFKLHTQQLSVSILQTVTQPEADL